MLKHRNFFAPMTPVSRLEFVLEHPTLCQPGRQGERNYMITEALCAAYNVLPDGKGKRALAYVIANPRAEFHFGGTDAVGPAIREAIAELKRLKAA